MDNNLLHGALTGIGLAWCLTGLAEVIIFLSLTTDWPHGALAWIGTLGAVWWTHRMAGYAVWRDAA